MFPYGWQKSDIDLWGELAASYGADPQDIGGIWFSESGLIPNCGDPKSPGSCAKAGSVGPGYYGLIMGNDAMVTSTAGMQSGAWKQIVLGGSIATQLAAIRRFWDAEIRGYLHGARNKEGEALVTRANQLGITPAGLLYGLNFVPGLISRVNTADAEMVKKGVLYNGTNIYGNNPGFDFTKKGFISARDMDLRISRLKDAANANPPTRALMSAVATSPATLLQKEKERASASSPWPAILGFGVAMGGILVGLHYVERAIR